MEIIDTAGKIGFSPEFMPRLLRVRPEYKVPLICMEPGQEIKPHQGGAGVFYFISGSAVMTVEGREHEVRAGCVVFVDKGESRGIRASAERLVAMAVHMNG